MSSINYVNFNNIQSNWNFKHNVVLKNDKKTKTPSTPNLKTKNSSAKDFTKINCSYLLNKFNINFSGGRRTLDLREQAAKLDLENLAPFILNNIQTAMVTNKDSNLYDIHTKIFAQLLKCKTLEEAKSFYPIFKNVIDAKSLPENKMSPTLIKIKNGKIEGITLENLSLALLKAHYGKGAGLNLKEEYFGLSKDAIQKMFDLLNIERLDGKYLRLLSDCNPIRREHTSRNWSAEKRAAHAKKANEIWDNKEKRQTQSENKKKWFQEHPEAKQEMSDRMKGTTLNPETRAKVSIGKKKFYEENPEFQQLRSESFEKHKHFKEIMKEVARKEFPYLRVIFLKKATGKPLENYEIKYMERYYKRCDELYPNGQKIVGETFSAMWKDFKQRKKDENN